MYVVCFVFVCTGTSTSTVQCTVPGYITSTTYKYMYRTSTYSTLYIHEVTCIMYVHVHVCTSQVQVGTRTGKYKISVLKASSASV